MITGLDHVAIAVTDLGAAIRRFLDDFGLDYEGTEPVHEAGTQTAFFPLSGTSIELVHPLEGGGPLAKYLDKHGGGIHHICFRTDNIVEDMEKLRSKGYRLLADEPQPGAHGSQVCFIHPKSCDGVLIELAQVPTEVVAHAEQAAG